MLKIYLHSLPILSIFACCHALKYAWVPPYKSKVSLIPDPKYHSFVQDILKTQGIIKNVTANDPVLRGCTSDYVFFAYIIKGQPRTEILTVFQEKTGEFLVNVTFNGTDLFVNEKHYVKTRWRIDEIMTEIIVEKHMLRTEVWSTLDEQGSVEFKPPEHEWVYITVGGYKCSEVKFKIVDGYAELVIERTDMAFPTEAYDDDLILPTTAVTTTAPTTLQSLENKIDDSESLKEKEVRKASTVTALICAAIAVLVLIAAALLSLVGCRLGRWHARKQALKKGHIKGKESFGSTTPDNVENKTTESAITPDSTKLLRTMPSGNEAFENASASIIKPSTKPRNHVQPKTPKEKDAKSLATKTACFLACHRPSRYPKKNIAADAINTETTIAAYRSPIIDKALCTVPSVSGNEVVFLFFFSVYTSVASVVAAVVEVIEKKLSS
uniref:Uncharacterized protein n=1 Tax=Panagrellus redivivus TaxID=6233 RepID=A0A7E4VSX1_PANRE